MCCQKADSLYPGNRVWDMICPVFHCNALANSRRPGYQVLNGRSRLQSVGGLQSVLGGPSGCWSLHLAHQNSSKTQIGELATISLCDVVQTSCQWVRAATTICTVTLCVCLLWHVYVMHVWNDGGRARRASPGGEAKVGRGGQVDPRVGRPHI